MSTHLLDALLADLPPHTHALTLAFDPGGLGHGEALQAALAERGFRTLAAGDPITLRAAWYAAQPVTPDQPLVIYTREALNALPYDLWQQGVRVDWSPARLFAPLDPAPLAGLSAAQLERVFGALQEQPPPAALGQAGSLQFVLRQAFGAEAGQLAGPGPLLGWLADLHGGGERLPAPLAEALLRQLQGRPALAGWPLADLLADAAAFKAFVQAQWQAYVRRIVETPADYSVQAAAGLIPFGADAAVQSMLGVLVHSGALAPVAVADPQPFGAWSHSALQADPALAAAAAWEGAAGEVTRALAGLPAAEREAGGPAAWPQWQAVARAWAALTVLRYGGGPLPAAAAGRYAALAAQLAPRYADWLHEAYGRLAGYVLPEPHHLYHIPHVLAQAVTGGARVALIVLDGMSLAAWSVIGAAWTARHAAWRLRESLVLAQVPTITAVSRQALLAGQPPRAFAASLDDNRQEEAHWRRFWVRRGLRAEAVAYASIAPRQARPLPEALDSRQTQALAVVLPDVDTLVHGSSTGLAGVLGGLRVWLDQAQSPEGSCWVEALIDNLLAHGYGVAVTSDHGHVEATGIGQPQEGVTVTTRSKRARLYDNAQFAANVQDAGFASQTILWHGDGLLPADMWALLARSGAAFAAGGQRVATHGGVTPDETIVPLIWIEQEHG